MELMEEVSGPLVTTETLSPEVQSFINERINSVEQLTILELLRSNPAREWTTAQISNELRSAPASIELRLADLYEAGVLARASESTHRYVPASDAMQGTLSQVLDVFRARPHRVIELLYSRPPKGILAFADAFKLKKEKP